MTNILPANSTADAASCNEFIGRWQGVEASELATSQSFVRELCTLLHLAVPHPTVEKDYMFERPVTFKHGNGSESPGRIDCYRRGAFVLEAKKLNKAPGKGFDDAMLRARAQAEGYARALPFAEGRPPFLLVVDVGNVIEIYAEFTLSGATYTPFPDPASHRIALADLVKPDVQARLRSIWLNPLTLDPSRTSARVTRNVAASLAEVAKSLEAAGNSTEAVAGFLTRCLFTMFAEDVGLLPLTTDGQKVFTDLLKRFRNDPSTLERMLHALWQDMDRGGFSAVLTQDVLRFNGKLFKQPTVLPLKKLQIDLLIDAANADWTEVEPAIFGTLLERALNPLERHSLGAHYTPRAYVERLVLPTVIEPLRADWSITQTAALLLANEAGKSKAKKNVEKMEAARGEVRRFHHALTQVRVLDPACGSGNFLYVTLEHMKRLEGEVLDLLAALGDKQQRLDVDGLTVDPHQFLGIEINPRAAAIAELVLWIGYLQWHFRTRGNAQPPQPVLKDFANIECRDGVLAYDGTEYALDNMGAKISRWNGSDFNTHPVTGEQVPDASALVPQLHFINPRKAAWPQADFIVGNPPFIGAATMRAALGDGYVEALRSTWKDVPSSSDFVMYWWHHAADEVRSKQTRRFGFITTNSLRQTFNRRVVEHHLRAAPPLTILFAIPDHPWVDVAGGAAVRIAMTVGQAGDDDGQLLLVASEEEFDGDDASVVELITQAGKINADLTVGTNLATAKTLSSNLSLCSMGVKLHGEGFIVTSAEALSLGLGTVDGLDSYVRPFRNGKDLTDRPRELLVIDLFGLSVEEVRNRFPKIFQWLYERVKPIRDANGGTKDGAGYAKLWWWFGKPRQELRKALIGLVRYIATTRTAKHRIFQFLDASIIPESKLVVVASEDAFLLGVLSSTLHRIWSEAIGGWLGVGNDPTYNHSDCFNKFPFPAEDAEATALQRARIAQLAEQIDIHRKQQQITYPELTLTGMYNVLEKLRGDEPLNTKEKVTYERGLVRVLKTLHDELDSAVLAAYGWGDLESVAAADSKVFGVMLLQRLVSLNLARNSEEDGGNVRWLRPKYQNPTAQTTLQQEQTQVNITLEDGYGSGSENANAAPQAMRWPRVLPEQVRAIVSALADSPEGLRLDTLEARFKGGGKWKKDLPLILDTLATLGRARSSNGVWYQS